ncbi:aromatic ring-hydroxylating oxygenase subunit alpha [Actinomadura scrupuli]|uniref:aromatic ring-hydroxylating oxygenase subunit alpha n=1 Tax=Actinomadura scrupuli TaxID=559629 RepID=UPI003D9646AD
MPEPAPASAELLPRVRRLVRARSTDYAEKTVRIPVGSYRDPHILEAERALVLHATPWVAAASCQLPAAGDYLVRELADRSVIVARDAGGRVRTLVNTCRHRGARVAAGAGSATRFTCPYHAWSYDLAGTLTSVPGRKGFDDIDFADHGLTELPTQERHGLVWCLPDARGPLDLDAHLGTLDKELAGWGYGAYWAAPVMEIDVAANWKAVLEAFSETYHFPFVHPDSLVGQGTIANIVSFDDLTPHHRLGVPLTTVRELPEDLGAEKGEHVAVLYFVYPNLVIANSPIGAEVIEARPVDATHSVLRHVFLSRTAPRDSAEERGMLDYVEHIRAVVRDEDGPVMDSAGAGLATAAHSDVLIGRNEPGCQNIHRQIQRALIRD